MIDVYSYSTDRFYGVKDPRAIIPREREMPRVVPEPEDEPPQVVPEPLEPSTMEPQEPTEAERVFPEEQPEASETVDSLATSTPAPVEPPQEQEATAPEEEGEARPEEESEPFADILQNKDKKRYSPNPLPNQSSE